MFLAKNYIIGPGGSRDAHQIGPGGSRDAHQIGPGGSRDACSLVPKCNPMMSSMVRATHGWAFSNGPAVM